MTIGKMQHHVRCECEKCIDHPSHSKPGIHAFPDRLYVVTMLENHDCGGDRGVKVLNSLDGLSGNVKRRARSFTPLRLRSGIGISK